MSYENLPLVEFEYPSSEDTNLRIRYVRVLTLDDDYLIGYEVEQPFDTDEEGKYKKFSLLKIVKNGIHLIEFTAPPKKD